MASEDTQNQYHLPGEHQEGPNRQLYPMQPYNVWNQHLNERLYDNNFAPQQSTPIYDPNQPALVLCAYSNYKGSWPAFPTPQGGTPVQDQVPTAKDDHVPATTPATKDNQPTGPPSTVDREAELKERIRASAAARSSNNALNSASSLTGADSRKHDSEDKSLGGGYGGTHKTRPLLTGNDIDQLITEEKNKALSVEMCESSPESDEILAAFEGPFTFAQTKTGPAAPARPTSVRVQMSRSGDKSHGSTNSPITNLDIMESIRNAIAQPSSGRSSVRISRQIPSPEGPAMTSVPQSFAAVDTQNLLPRNDAFVLTQERFPYLEDHKYIPEWLDATGFYDLHYRKRKLALYRANEGIARLEKELKESRANSTADLVAMMPQLTRPHPAKRANLNNPHEFHTSNDRIKPNTKRDISPSACRQNINEHDRKRSKPNGTSGKVFEIRTGTAERYNETSQAHGGYGWHHDARGEYRQNSRSDSFVDPRGRTHRYVNNDSTGTSSYRENHRNTSSAAPRDRWSSSPPRRSPSPNRRSYNSNRHRPDSGRLTTSSARRRAGRRKRSKPKANGDAVRLD